MGDRLKIRIRDPFGTAPYEWREIEANSVGCSGSVLIFSQVTRRAQTMQGPAGLLVQGEAQETRIVLVAQAIEGALEVLVEPVLDEGDVLSLEGRS